MINNYLIDLKKIGIGTSSYGSKIPYKDSFKIIECLLDHGLNYIDTSPFYGLGQSEKIIGEITKNKRDSIILSTKFGISPVINKSANKLIPIIKKIYYIPGIKSVVNNYVRSRNNRIQTLENISISIYQSLINLRTTYLNNLFY